MWAGHTGRIKTCFSVLAQACFSSSTRMGGRLQASPGAKSVRATGFRTTSERSDLGMSSSTQPTPGEQGATYAQRLREALRHSGKSRRQLASAIGVTEQAVANVYNGGPRTYFMANNSAEAAAFLGVDHYWLATGKGQMCGRRDWPFENVQLVEVQQLSEAERLQLEGGMRVLLAQMWRARNPDEPDLYRKATTLPAHGPLQEVPPELRALRERQRQLEDAARRTKQPNGAADATPKPSKTRRA